MSKLVEGLISLFPQPDTLSGYSWLSNSTPPNEALRDGKQFIDAYG
jgi:hypothetical protein